MKTPLLYAALLLTLALCRAAPVHAGAAEDAASAYAAADGWIWKGSLALGVIGVLTVALLWRRKCV